MAPFISAYWYALALVLSYMSIWYIAALYRKDNSIVDIAWGTNFILMGWFTLLQYGPISWKGALITVLVTIWGVRLSLHIYARHNGEDPRYAQWREAWEYVNLRSFLQVFMLQGFVSSIIAIPVIYANVTLASLGIWDVIGGSVWAIGFLCEVIADWQLQRFIEHNQEEGAIMMSGLWRYSRHPNYFGESLIWWGNMVNDAVIAVWLDLCD